MPITINFSTSALAVSNVTNAENRDIKKTKFKESLQNTINAQAAYTVACNFKNITNQLRDIILLKVVAKNSFEIFKKEKSHIRMFFLLSNVEW